MGVAAARGEHDQGARAFIRAQGFGRRRQAHESARRALSRNPTRAAAREDAPREWRDGMRKGSVADDQTRLIKNICKAENVDIKQLSPRFILAIIDRWKNKGYYPSEVIINKKDIYEKTILPLYKIYQQKLTDLNSCDFGDLILHTVKILEHNQDIRKIYSNNFSL